MASSFCSLNDSSLSEADRVSTMPTSASIRVESSSPSVSVSSDNECNTRVNSKRRRSSNDPFRSYLSQKVSAWKRKHAEKLGIVYAKSYSGGLQALKMYINGNINEFTQDQLDYMEFLDKHITFSLTLSNFYIDYPCEDSRAEAELSLAESMLTEYDRQSSNWDFVLKIKNFIKGLRKFNRDIRYYRGSRMQYAVAEGLLTHLVGSFAELCYLDVEYCNQAHQAEMDLYGTIVRSEPDLRLYTSGPECEASNTMVSVIKVKPGYRSSPDPDMGLPRKRLTGSLRSCDYGVILDKEHADPIALNLHDDVLGQHAGELLLDLHLKYRMKSSTCYEDDCKVNMLGMLVDGSLIYLTVLEMTWQHYQKLKNNQPLEPEDQATIQYTSPQNFLMAPEIGRAHV